MTEWITEDDWSTVKLGDQVRVTHEGGDELKGYVDWVFNGLDDDIHRIYLDVPALPESVEIRDSEWFLSVPAEPAVVIPPEPGVYSDRDGITWQLFGRIYADENQHQWQMIGIPQSLEIVESCAPFTKLEEVAVTAKKVLGEVEAWAFGPALDGAPNEITDTLKRLRERFGVTDE